MRDERFFQSSSIIFLVLAKVAMVIGVTAIGQGVSDPQLKWRTPPPLI